MFALRLVRVATPSAPAQTRSMAAKAKGERLTWRQKAKIQAARQTKPAAELAAAKPPRVKIERQNFLADAPVDDGKKWRILSASVLERLPIIQPDLEDWEMDYEMMEHEIALKEDQRLEEDFWFMEPGERHITPEEAPWPNAEEDPEEIVGAGFHLAPRETDDDATNNRKSLNRALKQRVFLLVKPSSSDAAFPWFFPADEKRADEKMRDAALRALAEVCGDELEVNPIGFAPMGYVTYPHADQADGYDGTKVFFYKAQFRYGDLKLDASKASDFEWVTQTELAEYFEQDVAAYLTKMVPQSNASVGKHGAGSKTQAASRDLDEQLVVTPEWRLLGAHVSASGGGACAIANATSQLGPRARSFAFFIRPRLTWRRVPPLAPAVVDKFHTALATSQFARANVVVHGSYLINFASHEAELRRKSVALMVDEVLKCEQLGVGLYVFHPGASTSHAYTVGKKKTRPRKRTKQATPIGKSKRTQSEQAGAKEEEGKEDEEDEADEVEDESETAKARALARAESIQFVTQGVADDLSRTAMTTLVLKNTCGHGNVLGRDLPESCGCS